MIAGFVIVYLNCHALAHYLTGRAVGLRFRGYGVRGTDRPEVYPAGTRQLMQAAPFYVALSTKESREQASRRAKAIYYAAGETRPPSARSPTRDRRRRRCLGRPDPARRDDHLQRHLDHRHDPQLHRRLRIDQCLHERR
jgi:hypothetical protein